MLGEPTTLQEEFEMIQKNLRWQIQYLRWVADILKELFVRFKIEEITFSQSDLFDMSGVDKEKGHDETNKFQAKKVSTQFENLDGKLSILENISQLSNMNDDEGINAQIAVLLSILKNILAQFRIYFAYFNRDDTNKTELLNVCAKQAEAYFYLKRGITLNVTGIRPINTQILCNACWMTIYNSLSSKEVNYVSFLNAIRNWLQVYQASSNMAKRMSRETIVEGTGETENFLREFGNLPILFSDDRINKLLTKLCSLDVFYLELLVRLITILAGFVQSIAVNNYVFCGGDEISQECSHCEGSLNDVRDYLLGEMNLRSGAQEKFKKPVSDSLSSIVEFKGIPSKFLPYLILSVNCTHNDERRRAEALKKFNYFSLRLDEITNFDGLFDNCSLLLGEVVDYLKKEKKTDLIKCVQDFVDSSEATVHKSRNYQATLKERVCFKIESSSALIVKSHSRKKSGVPLVKSRSAHPAFGPGRSLHALSNCHAIEVDQFPPIFDSSESSSKGEEKKGRRFSFRNPFRRNDKKNPPLEVDVSDGDDSVIDSPIGSGIRESNSMNDLHSTGGKNLLPSSVSMPDCLNHLAGDRASSPRGVSPSGSLSYDNDRGGRTRRLNRSVVNFGGRASFSSGVPLLRQSSSGNRLTRSLSSPYLARTSSVDDLEELARNARLGK